MYEGVCRSSDWPKLSWDSGTIDSCDSSDDSGVEVRIGRSLFGFGLFCCVIWVVSSERLIVRLDLSLVRTGVVRDFELFFGPFIVDVFPNCS